MSAVTCPPVSVKLAVHVVPHEALLPSVAKRKYLWLQQLKAACAEGQRNKLQSSPPVITSLTRQWPAGIQRSPGAAPGRVQQGKITELCSVVSSEAVAYQTPVQLCSHCSCRNERKTAMFSSCAQMPTTEASTGSQGNSPPTGK